MCLFPGAGTHWLIECCCRGLLHPTTCPQGRRHDEFIMRLREVIPSRLDVLEGVVRAAHEAGFELQVRTL